MPVRCDRTPLDATRAGKSLPTPVLFFLAVLCALFTLVNVLIPWSTEAGQAIGGLAIMWCPAAAAAAASIRRDGRPNFGWRWPGTHFLVLGYTIPVAYGLIPFVVDYVVEHGRFTTAHWASYSEHLGLSPSVFWGPVLLATIEPVFSMIAAAGEEIGWRGFLLPALMARYRFWLAVGISWAVWLSFHLPGIINGSYGHTGAPVWFSGACFAAMLFASTVIMSWLRIASNSVWPCILSHAVHNVFIQEVAPSAFYGGRLAPWLSGEFGLLTALLAAVVAVILVPSLRSKCASDRTHGGVAAETKV